MSKIGVIAFADALNHLQNLRITLLMDPRDHQNVRLAELCERMKDAASDDFARVATECSQPGRSASSPTR